LKDSECWFAEVEVSLIQDEDEPAPMDKEEAIIPKRKRRRTEMSIAKKAEAACVQAPLGFLAKAYGNTWTLLDFCFDDYDAWAANILSADPPSLRLQGHRLGGLPVFSAGSLHETELKKCKKMHTWVTHNNKRHLCVGKKALQRVSKKLLEDVRYPPTSLEVSFQVSDTSQKNNKKEKGRKGRPRRPFARAPVQVADKP